MESSANWNRPSRKRGGESALASGGSVRARNITESSSFWVSLTQSVSTDRPVFCVRERAGGASNGHSVNANTPQCFLSSYWATLSLNMPDFTRFGRSQREQVLGQVVALPTTMAVFATMGVLITSATVIIYGRAIWDPVQLVGEFRSPVVVAVSMFTAVVATLSVNIGRQVGRWRGPGFDDAGVSIAPQDS